MNTFAPRTRGTVPQRKFADQAKAARAANTSQRGQRVEGKFDRLILTQKPIWLRFSPEQLYAQMLYNKEEKKVIETGTEEWPARPWYEYKTHFVVATERPHTCSSGPYRLEPCRGCSARADFYEKQRIQRADIKEKTGIDSKEKKEAPVQESVRYAMAVTCLEKIFEMPVIGKGGKVRTSRDGKELINFVPAPNSGFDPKKIKETSGEFGHNYHWSFGPTHLGNLSSIDQTLWNSCASCASALMATQFGCAECGGVAYEDETGITGTDLRTMRETVLKCPHCAHEGFGVPLLLCTGCENPVEGSILTFDLRLRLDYPDPNDKKKTTVVLEEFRLPDYEKLFPKDAERIFEMLYAPLDVVAIFAPEDLASQASAYPDDMKRLAPNLHIELKKRQTSAPYGKDSGEGPPGDQDQMVFDDTEGTEN